MLLNSFTPQIFYFPKFSKGTAINQLRAKPAASGILFSVCENYFLLTAKHVFEGAALHDFAIISNNGIGNLSGEVRYFEKPSEIDNIDLALIKLAPHIVSGISKRYSFLPFELLEFNHTLSTSNIYFMHGFLANKTKVIGKQILSKPFGFYTKLATVTNFERLLITQSENIPLHYDQEDQGEVGATHRSQGPKDLRGLSGGGIWWVEIDQDEGRVRNRGLIGIVIEEKLRKDIIIGTQIHLVADLLRYGYGISIDQTQKK